MKDLSSELKYKFSRSGGKGGQSVNKLSTKVMLRFDVQASQLLSDAEKATIEERLSSLINKKGRLKLNCDETRSQLENKEIVTERFHELIEAALAPVKKRKKTKLPRSANENRLKDKKIIGRKKQNRRMDDDWND